MIVLFITIFDPQKKLKICQIFNPRGASEGKKAYFTFLAEPFGATVIFFPMGRIWACI